MTGGASPGQASWVGKRRKDSEKESPLTPDEILIRDEITRQLLERRHRPAAVFDPKQFALDSRARRVAYAQIGAHPRVKVALLMAERLRHLALRIDAVLSFQGDPTRTRHRATALALAPALRELADLCAPYEGSLERQRDKLIDLVDWAASMLMNTDRDEPAWGHVVSTLKFELTVSVPDVGEHVSDEDLRRSISVFMPDAFRPAWKDALSKWEQLALLVRKGRLGTVPSETIRTEYTRRRSSKRKQERAEREELASLPLGNKLDDAGLTGVARERAEEQIRALEARALMKLRVLKGKKS